MKISWGMTQAVVLIAITLGTLVYTLCKEKIRTKHCRQIWLCVLIGLVLGIMSSFLGIGGGPINLVVLAYFFSMSTKEAALSPSTSSCSPRSPALCRPV